MPVFSEDVKWSSARKSALKELRKSQILMVLSVATIIAAITAIKSDYNLPVVVYFGSLAAMCVGVAYVLFYLVYALEKTTGK